MYALIFLHSKIFLTGSLCPSSTSLTAEEARKALVKELLSVIKALRRSEDIYSRNPLPRLLRIMDRDMTSNDMFLRPGAWAFFQGAGGAGGGA